MGEQKLIRMFLAMVTVLGLLFLAACASTPPPSDKLANVGMAIQRARESEAQKYAPLELKLAVEKYEKAKDAVEEEEYDRARRLADEALIDAQLAESKAKAEKQKKIAQDMQESVETLREELKRKP